MPHHPRRLLRTEIGRLERRIRRLEARLARGPRVAAGARQELAGLRASLDATCARLLEAELKP